MSMPLDYINTLYKIADERNKAELAKRNKEIAEGKQPSLSNNDAMVLEDELEEAFTWTH